jgi:hypothetical protein
VVLDPRMLVVHNPKKKATNFVSKITDDNGKTVRVKIPYCKALYLKENASNGHLLRIVLEKDTMQYNKIQEIDTTTCNYAIINNKKWFNNELTPEEITAMCRPSLNTEYNTMTVMILDMKDIVICLNDSVIDVLEEIDFTNPTLYLSLQIEAQGLYFFPKKFGIRWVVTKLSLYSEYPLTINPDDDIDRDTVENDWESEIRIIEKNITKDIENLNNTIAQKTAYLKNLQEHLHMTKTLKFDEEWNNKLIELSHKIVKYYREIPMTVTQ